MAAQKPEPRIDRWNRPFWEACREHRLIAQRCGETGQLWLPPGAVSPFAPGAAWSWAELAGLGRVESWVVMHQRYFEGFADELPYNVAQIRLDEGPQWIANLVGVEREALTADLRVRVVFVDPETPEGWTIPQFTPA